MAAWMEEERTRVAARDEAPIPRRCHLQTLVIFGRTRVIRHAAECALIALEAFAVAVDADERQAAGNPDDEERSRADSPLAVNEEREDDTEHEDERGGEVEAEGVRHGGRI